MLVFIAPWSAPCRRQMAASRTVARRLASRAGIYAVDIEANCRIAARYNIPQHSDPDHFFRGRGAHAIDRGPVGRHPRRRPEPLGAPALILPGLSGKRLSANPATSPQDVTPPAVSAQQRIRRLTGPWGPCRHILEFGAPGRDAPSMQKESVMSEHLLEVTDSNFESQVLNAAQPVLVDFWAPWCGPCRAVGPVVDQLAGKYADQMRFAKMNVDEEPGHTGTLRDQGHPDPAVFQRRTTGGPDHRHGFRRPHRRDHPQDQHRPGHRPAVQDAIKRTTTRRSRWASAFAIRKRKATTSA